MVNDMDGAPNHLRADFGRPVASRSRWGSGSGSRFQCVDRECRCRGRRDNRSNPRVSLTHQSQPSSRCSARHCAEERFSGPPSEGKALAKLSRLSGRASHLFANGRHAPDHEHMEWAA